MGSSLGSWAMVNIGADQPTDYGYHLSWAYIHNNPEGKDRNKSHYKTITYTLAAGKYTMPIGTPGNWDSGGTDGTFAHYGYSHDDCPTYGIYREVQIPLAESSLNNLDKNGFIDADTKLLTDRNDYAYKMDGWKDGTWKTPNIDELNALCARDDSYTASTALTTRKWVRMKNKNGQDISGVLLISKANGNCVFLGAWGAIGDTGDSDADRIKFSQGCYYWSSLATYGKTDSEAENIVVTSNNGVGTITAKQDHYTRNRGFQIRPKRR